MPPRNGRHPHPAPERELLQQVRDLARLLGWRVYHTHDSRRSPEGFPDLVLVRPPRLLFVELKREGRGPTLAQHGWLEALAAVPGVEVYLWRPGDWELVVATLHGELRC
jgi:hypothetical protein